MTFIPANVFALDSKQIATDNYVFNVVKETDDYTEMLITNKRTGEEEILKSYVFKNGERLFSAEKNNEITYLKSEKDEYVILDENFNVIDRQRITDDIISFDRGITVTADWGDKVNFSGDKKTDYTNISIVISVICLVSGAPATAAAVLLISDFIVNNFISNVYYKGWYRTKWEDALYYKQTVTSFYEYSNYTGLIGTTDVIDFH